MTWNIFLFEMHYLLLFHAHWHEINVLGHKKNRFIFHDCLTNWGEAGLIHSQRLVINMLLRGFDYSLWESHDPKFNVHPETESDSFLKCSDITRWNYSCGHGCALRDIHTMDVFAHVKIQNINLTVFQVLCLIRKLGIQRTSMCLSLEKGVDMSTVNLLIYIRFPVSCWGLG